MFAPWSCVTKIDRIFNRKRKQRALPALPPISGTNLLGITSRSDRGSDRADRVAAICFPRPYYTVNAPHRRNAPKNGVLHCVSEKGLITATVRLAEDDLWPRGGTRGVTRGGKLESRENLKPAHHT